MVTCSVIIESFCLETLIRPLAEADTDAINFESLEWRRAVVAYELGKVIVGGSLGMPLATCCDLWLCDGYVVLHEQMPVSLATVHSVYLVYQELELNEFALSNVNR